MDLTPLIDVVFLLLVFFMVSSVFQRDDYILDLTLPESSTAMAKERGEKKINVLEVNEREIGVNGKTFSLEELPGELGELDSKTPLHLRIGKKVKYERFIKALDILKEAKFLNISLMTEKNEKP